MEIRSTVIEMEANGETMGTSNPYNEIVVANDIVNDNIEQSTENTEHLEITEHEDNAEHVENVENIANAEGFEIYDQMKTIEQECFTEQVGSTKHEGSNEDYSTCIHSSNNSSSNVEHSESHCNCRCHSQDTMLSYTNPSFTSSSLSINDETSSKTPIENLKSSSNENPGDRNIEVITVSSLSNGLMWTESTKSLPKYNTLGRFILNDEPPKYEEVTGNQLANQLDTSSKVTHQQQDRQTTNSNENGNIRRKIAGVGIFLAVVVVTILLIYLSVTGAASSIGNEQQNKLSDERFKIRPR